MKLVLQKKYFTDESNKSDIVECDKIFIANLCNDKNVMSKHLLSLGHRSGQKPS